MTLHSKTLILSALGGFLLVSCAPQKKEEAPSAPQAEPFAQPEEVSPSETQGLSPHQVEELKIDEDNVANPFPG
jgi:hypothetical protein